MVAAYMKGNTLQQIGTVYGITRERVRQVLRKVDCPADMGGARLRSFVRVSEEHRKQQAKKAKKLSKIEMYFGCAYEVLEPFVVTTPWSDRGNKLKTPVVAYMQQRRSAEYRKIGWEISFADWWRIWQESGKWEQRGRGKTKYVMARLGDSGPYSENNVYITTQSQNCKDYYAVAENKARWRVLMNRPLKEFCDKGHPLSGDNVYPTRRTCRICQRQRCVEYYQRQKSGSCIPTQKA